MNDDIRARLTFAALGAPDASSLPTDLRGRIRARRAGRIAVTVAMAGALVAGSVTVAGRLVRSIDVASTDCGGPWTVAPFDIATKTDPARVLTPHDGVIAGPGDVWLTALEPRRTDGMSTAILNGDGRKWQRRDLPDGENANLSALASDGSTVWAAGYRSESAADATTLRPLLYRFDGSTWRTESLPQLPDNSTIWALAIRGDRIIAGGATTVAERRDGVRRHVSETAFLIERSGGVWRARFLPDLRGDYAVQRIVIGRDGQLILQTRGDGGIGIVIEDGDGWRILTPPGKPIVVAAVRSAVEMWAIRPFVVANDQVELLRYDGRSWSVTPIAMPGMTSIGSLAAGASGEAWLMAQATLPDASGIPGGPGVSRLGRSELFRIKGTRIVKEPIQRAADVRSVRIAAMDDAGRGIAVGSFRDTKLAPHPVVLTRCIG